MKHHTTDEFWELYYALPAEVQELADKNYELLKRDPRHPSLHFKPLGRHWSARVGRQYRALADRQPDGNMVWFWIGHHSEYDKLLALAR